jgi:hypothetical protein
MTISQREHPDCFVCGERLTDPQSISRGIGPVCAGKLTKFLAAVGSSAEEIAALALIEDGAVAKWLRVAAKAVGLGRIEEAKGFFKSARRAAAAAQAEAAEEKAA